MINLCIIWHMHQPFYEDLVENKVLSPWVRLHSVKDYMDMVFILNEFPKIKLTFNLTPSLLEQIINLKDKKDRYLELSYKKPSELTPQERDFIIDNFFKCNLENMITPFPRYYELFQKKNKNQEFTDQDILDLQVLFNLSWIDPTFRFSDPRLKEIVIKSRFFSEEDKIYVLEFHQKILNSILDTYKRFLESGQIEITTSPFYHPILPLIFSSKIALCTFPECILPSEIFSYPEDVKAQISSAVEFFKNIFGKRPEGVWPSEQAVSHQILDFFIEEKIKWIVTDEAILFKSIKEDKDRRKLYSYYFLETKKGKLNVFFRDKNLSDLISFVYYKLPPQEAVKNFREYLCRLKDSIKEECIVVIALDGENAWEYYKWDGYDFLRELYKTIQETDWIRTLTPSDCIKKIQPLDKIEELSAGSWIFGNFSKWIGTPTKNYAWELLGKARKILKTESFPPQILEKALKQIYILEGSDWFWWFDDTDGEFDELFRLHLRNFYHIIGKKVPEELKHPLKESLVKKDEKQTTHL